MFVILSNFVYVCINNESKNIMKATTTPTEIRLVMLDFITGMGVLRTIDISNLFIDNSDVCIPGMEGWMIAPEENHNELLNMWIQNRGNDQHEAELMLMSYTLA